MARTVRFLILTLLLADIGFRFFAHNPSPIRDTYLYNAIWILSLALVFTAPLNLDRVALAAIALAIFSWGIGSIASIHFEFTYGAEIAYSLFYPLILIAIPRFSSASQKLTSTELLDALIVGLGLTSIITTFLLVALFPPQSLVSSGDYFLLFYPVGDIALLLTITISIATQGINKAKALLLAAVIAFATTDFYYLWLVIHKKYNFGDPIDDGWLIAITLLAFATIESQPKKVERRPIHPALTAIAIFISPVILAISALKPDLAPSYILIPAIANLLLAFIRMSTALRESRALNAEKVLARTDALTGLSNRRVLLAELDNFSQVEGALLLLDLDGFKPVNDKYGHEVGDLLLQQISYRFQRALPENATLARLGGDEFGVLLRGSYEETLEIAYALRATLSYPIAINGNAIEVGVSIGYVHNDGAGNLLQRADSAMYKAKQMDMGVAQP